MSGEAKGDPFAKLRRVTDPAAAAAITEDATERARALLAQGPIPPPVLADVAALIGPIPVRRADRPDPGTPPGWPGTGRARGRTRRRRRRERPVNGERLSVELVDLSWRAHRAGVDTLAGALLSLAAEAAPDATQALLADIASGRVPDPAHNQPGWAAHVARSRAPGG